MKWPTHTDYQDSIQSPEICFEDADLKTGQVANDMLGLPRVMSGNFASVYELTTAQGHWAIRCFVRQVPGQQGRYARLSEHLAKLTTPYLVKFQFIQRGILVLGDWYPAMKMEWVAGVPLNVYVEENHKNAEIMTGLAAKWRDLVNELRRQQVAHGDFQHGNVMVTPQGELRLVDYDGMFVPAFGRGRSPELGHANFQHPRRTPDYYDERLDNFSAITIYLSFLALAKDPGLWQKFYLGDNLVLASADFRNPRNSPAMHQLKQNPDPRVQQLAALVEQCCLLPIDQVPWFEDAVNQAENGSLKTHLEKMPAPPAGTAETWWEDAPPDPGPTASRPAPAAASPVAPTSTRPAAPTPAATRPATPAPAQTRPAAPVTAGAGGVTGGTRPAAPMISRAGANYSGSRPSPAVAPGQPVAPVVPGASTATVHIPEEKDPALMWVGAAAVMVGLALVPALRPWFGLGAAGCGAMAFMKAKPESTLLKFGGLAAGLVGLGLGILGLMSFFGDKAKPAKVSEGLTPQEVAMSHLQAPAATATQAVAKPLPAPAPAPRPVDVGLRATLLGSLSGHAKAVGCLGFSKDARWLASGAGDNSVKIWDVQAGKLKRSLDGQTDAVEYLAFLPEGKSLEVVSSDNVASVWDVDAGQVKARVSRFTNNLWTIRVSPDGQTIATGAADRKIVKVVDPQSGEAKKQLPSLPSWVKSARFSPDGRYLAIGCFDDSLHLWELASPSVRWSISAKGNAAETVVFSGDGSKLAMGAEGKLVWVVDGATGKIVQTMAGHLGEVKVCAMTSDGHLVASGGVDKTVRIWMADDGKLVQTLSGHSDEVTALAFSLDGRLLASGAADRTVKLWSMVH